MTSDDGVTIAKEFELKDPEQDLGARMMRQVAERTSDLVGDGTTTSAILAHAIYAEGLRNVAAGASAIELKRGLDRALGIAKDALAHQSRAVTSKREKVQVASVSAHGDRSIGELVADAVDRVGREGAVSVEEAKTTESSLEVVEGMQFDRGYLSPYFVTDGARMECVLEEPLILLHDGKLRAMKDLLPLLELIARTRQPLLIIAEDVEDDALATLILNKVRGVLPGAAVKAPGFGDRRKAVLEDIAILTGGKVISAELGVSVEHATLDLLGRATRVVIDAQTTTIVGGRGQRAAIDGRIDQLRLQIEKTTSTYDKEKLEERLAKLAGGVAVIRVGAPSETELKSRKEAFEDAIASTKAAIDEGILPGGGLALVRAADAIASAIKAGNGNSDQVTGMRILGRALEAPARQIAENSGADPGVVVDKLRSGSGNFGFDAAAGTYVDLIEAGIVDAAKVVRIALENAVSVASVLLLTEATLTEEPEKERAHAQPEL